MGVAVCFAAKGHALTGLAVGRIAGSVARDTALRGDRPSCAPDRVSIPALARVMLRGGALLAVSCILLFAVNNADLIMVGQLRSARDLEFLLSRRMLG